MKSNLRFVIFVCLLLVLNSLTGILYAKQHSKQEKTESDRLTIKVKPGIVTVIPASKGYLNHLKITGISNFKAISSGGIDIHRIGENLLVTFQQGEHPADLAIRDINTDEVYLFALVPKPIPPRSYEILLLPDSQKKKRAKKKTANNNPQETQGQEVKNINEFLPIYPLAKPEGYEKGFESFLLDTISKVAMSKKINGATFQPDWNTLVINYNFKPLKGLKLYSVKRWFISKYEIDLFQAKNEGKHPIMLKEPYLWQKGVLSVSFIYNFFQKEDEVIKLHPHETVPVIIVRIKQKES